MKTKIRQKYGFFLIRDSVVYYSGCKIQYVAEVTSCTTEKTCLSYKIFKALCKLTKDCFLIQYITVNKKTYFLLLYHFLFLPYREKSKIL
jgi:hypothetical protein